MDDDEPYDLIAHIEKYFDGDIDRYNADSLRVRKETLDWSVLCASEEVFPQFAKEAENIIGKRLGYLPSLTLRRMHELHIRTLMHRYTNDVSMNQQEFRATVDMHIKHARNEDMRTNRCVERNTHNKTDHENYATRHLEFRELAQKKIRYLLGYDPELLYALDPELMFRAFLSTISSKDRHIITPIDYRVVGMIKYRETFLKYGAEAADNSPLMGIGWDASFTDPVNYNSFV